MRLLVALFLAVPAWAQESAESYARRVAALLPSQKEELLKVCRSGDLSEIYFSSYELDGLLAAAEATGREDLLEAALECVDAIVAAGQDRDGDGYVDFYHSVDRAWDSRSDGISPSTLVKGLRPVARAGRVIMTRFARKPWLARAQKLVPFTEKHIVEKWRKQGHLGSCRSGTIHIQGNMGEILVDAYVATGYEEHRKLAEGYAQAAKDNMVLVDGAYVWNQALGNRTLNQVLSGSVDGAHVSDTSHANETLAFATLACRAGIVFTAEDMQRFCATLTKKLWRGPDKPLADFVDGALWQGAGGAGKWGGSLAAGWAKLGLFSPQVQGLLAQREGGSHPIQYWGNLALNAALGASPKLWRLGPGRAAEKKTPAPKGSVGGEGPWVPPTEEPKKR